MIYRIKNAKYTDFTTTIYSSVQRRLQMLVEKGYYLITIEEIDFEITYHMGRYRFNPGKPLEYYLRSPGFNRWVSGYKLTYTDQYNETRSLSDLNLSQTIVRSVAIRYHNYEAQINVEVSQCLKYC